MPKSFVILIALSVISLATSSPFFPDSPSSSTSAPINFDSNTDDDFDQKPAVIPPTNRDPFPPQTTYPISPSAPATSFSTARPALGPESPVPPQTQDRQHIDPRFCTKIQDPVCGSNGRTYGNLCMLTQDQRSDPSLVVAKQGEC